MTVADLVFEDLAAEGAELRSRAAELEAERDTYRSIVVAAFESLRELTLANDRQREQLAHLREQYRALREQTLTKAAA